MPGLYVNLTGTMVTVTVGPNHAVGVTDIPLFMEKKIHKDFWDTEVQFILEKRQAVWLPFGCILQCHYLSEDRPSKVVKAEPKAKAKAKSKKKVAESQDVQYGGFVFIPICSEFDYEQKPELVHWVYSSLSRTQKAMPKAFTAQPKYRDWLEKLNQISMKTGFTEQDGIEDAAAKEKDKQIPL